MKAIRSKTKVRRLHKESHDRYRPLDLVFLLQDWEDAYNVGAMFRLADAIGARELVVTGRTPIPPDPMISVTSLGHHRRIPFRVFTGHEEAALAIKREGYALVAVEIAEGAVSCESYDYPHSTCLVLGNEAGGIYGSVMKHRDAAVHVPMFGKGRSMNVVTAAAVVAYCARMRPR